MLLKLLADAVNTVADWPASDVMLDDDPRSRMIGYRVGEFRLLCSLTQVRRDIPEVVQKTKQLARMVAEIRVPLRAFPDDQREREILARHALLASAVHVTNIEMRRQTAGWIAFLGRLRADPSGGGGFPEYLPVLPRGG